jgi:hypothetical protein
LGLAHRSWGPRAVPRRYFHFSDGKRTFSDAHGVELTGITAARENAKSQIRELKGSLSERTVQSWSGWKMFVTNDNGQTVFEIGFDSKMTE